MTVHCRSFFNIRNCVISIFSRSCLCQYMTCVSDDTEDLNPLSIVLKWSKLFEWFFLTGCDLLVLVYQTFWLHIELVAIQYFFRKTSTTSCTRRSILISCLWWVISLYLLPPCGERIDRRCSETNWRMLPFPEVRHFSVSLRYLTDLFTHNSWKI